MGKHDKDNKKVKKEKRHDEKHKKHSGSDSDSGGQQGGWLDLNSDLANVRNQYVMQAPPALQKPPQQLSPGQLIYTSPSEREPRQAALHPGLYSSPGHAMRYISPAEYAVLFDGYDKATNHAEPHLLVSSHCLGARNRTLTQSDPAECVGVDYDLRMRMR